MKPSQSIIASIALLSSFSSVMAESEEMPIHHPESLTMEEMPPVPIHYPETAAPEPPKAPEPPTDCGPAGYPETETEVEPKTATETDPVYSEGLKVTFSVLSGLVALFAI